MARGSGYDQGQGVEVALREFAPDLDPTSPGILTNITGAIPTVKGFRAMPGKVPYSLPLPAAVCGAIRAHYSNGAMQVFAGTPTHLYRIDPIVGTTLRTPDEFDTAQTFTIFTTPTPADPAIIRPMANSGWRFFQFGDDVIAVARNNTPQVSSGTSTGITQFAPLGGITPGTVPWGATCGISCAGFAFLFSGQQWFCSAAGVDNVWTADIQTLAANGILYDVPGEITGAASFYRTVIVFKQHAVWLGSFVGAPNSWQFQLISNTTGTFSQECIVPLPDAVAFLGVDDFYITTGSVPIRIPNSLKEWFFATADPDLLAYTQGHYDQTDATIYWHAISRAAAGTLVPDFFVSYNVRAKRWGMGELNVACIATCLFAETQVQHFDEHDVCFTMTGAPQPMSLTTGYYGIPSRLTQLFRVRAKWTTRPNLQTLHAFYTNTLGVPNIEAEPTPQLGLDDWFNLRQYARYHQLVLTTTGDAELSALAYEARTGGVR